MAYGRASDGIPPIEVAEYRLIRRIGRGAYGEVWLARNTLGGACAIKVIHRADFEEDRPYQREFEGIRRYEPISRSHPNLVQVLHAGRNDGAGYFYYVMELADAAEPAVRPDDSAYAPRTLRGEVRRRGRLEAPECISVALGLAEALRHLHEHHLVHRDVKPSNVVFVGGVPKLADIGLVAGRDDAPSYVGTDGYIPPEGPGSPQADIFALGRLLYEISTGKDRQEYPEPLTHLGSIPDRERLLELNAVILAACDPDPRRRYATAAAMADDLKALVEGRSVRARRARAAWRRRGRHGAVFASAAILALILVWQAWDRGLPGTTPSGGPNADAVRLVREAQALSPTTKEGFSAILEKCHAALELDARYAPAHGVLANAYRESAGWNRAERDAMLEAKRAARRALELDPAYVPAHTQLGLILMLSDWDFAGAEAHFRRGLELDPSNLSNLSDYANFFRSMGRLREARELVERAVRLMPPPSVSKSQVARIEWALLLYSERRFDEMLRVVGEIRAASPGLIMVEIYTGLAHAGAGRMGPALDAFGAARQHDDGPDLIALEGYCHGRLGHSELAQAALDRLSGFAPVIAISPYYRAYILAGMGDLDAMFAELNRCVDVRSGSVVGYAWRGLIADAIWDPFHRDPRWPVLLGRVGLPAAGPLAHTPPSAASGIQGAVAPAATR